MRKQTLFFGLLLGILLFGSCDPNEDSSSPKNTKNNSNGNDPNGNDPSSNALSLLQNYKTQYATVNKGTEYKSSQWVDNILRSYRANGTTRSETTYDNKGRQTKLVYYDYSEDPAKPTKDTIKYRYEGEGNSYRLYDKVHTTEGNNKEYKSREWVDNTLKYYDPAGNVFIEDTYDNKGRISESTDNDKNSSYILRYEGDGPKVAALIIDPTTPSLNTYKYTIQYAKEEGEKEYKSSEWVGNIWKEYGGEARENTYDAKGRITKYVSDDGSGNKESITIYRYE